MNQICFDVIISAIISNVTSTSYCAQRELMELQHCLISAALISLIKPPAAESNAMRATHYACIQLQVCGACMTFIRARLEDEQTPTMIVSPMIDFSWCVDDISILTLAVDDPSAWIRSVLLNFPLSNHKLTAITRA